MEKCSLRDTKKKYFKMFDTNYERFKFLGAFVVLLLNNSFRISSSITAKYYSTVYGSMQISINPINIENQ